MPITFWLSPEISLVMDKITSAMEWNFLAIGKTGRKNGVGHHMRGTTGQEEEKKGFFRGRTEG